MESPVLRVLATVVASIMGLAIISVILSQKSNTTAVINAGSTGLSGLITAATAPVSGQSGNIYGGY